ncbi:aminopeptidase O [Elysia marginata]|uniref:Aminopeptidase O n=1 Tax=Elysia marginata TaxID=1093978 RepID=A0AAV4HVH9_9GAST|nr:aminopeptidase O [Elysia marginata]
MDLPLSSNYKEIQVVHWILDLACDFAQSQLSGSATLYCQSKSFLPNSECEKLESKECAEQNLSMISAESGHGNSTSTTSGLDESFNQAFVLDCHNLDIEACFFHNLEQENFDVATACQRILSTDIGSQTDHQSKDNQTSLQVDTGLIHNYLNIYRKLKEDNTKKLLNFHVDKTCLRMYIPNSHLHGNQIQVSFVVQIIYKTQKDGPSLTWTLDQNMQPCVYTSGHLLNNRSLMPCQDMPQAMGTWHCFISVPADNAKLLELDKVNVLMAGEAEPNILVEQDGTRMFCYHSSYPMPASTFALAIGTWSEYSPPKNKDGSFGDASCQYRSLGPSVRIFAPSKFHERALQGLTAYLPSCFSALSSVLGQYPLHRLDILIVPASFDSLGMMSPHLMFLSQSILVQESSEAEGGMLYRVAHELCHTWFGVLSGPRDWTEEWLTEGICCYLEDVVHATALQWNVTETRERLQLRCLLKSRVLKAEISTTSDDLQTLRPNGDASATSSSNSTNANNEPLVVKNGLNPGKTLLQVHYLKGFFLLKHLEQVSGKEEFLQVLRTFIENKLGHLFSSMDLLEFCFTNLHKLRQSDLTVSSVCEEWLDTPGMPQCFSGQVIDDGNKLYTQVCHQLSILKAGAGRKRINHQPDKLQGPACTETSLAVKRLLPEQRVLLLDLLVEEDVKLTRSQMQQLRQDLRVEDATAEVQHSWCELVVVRKAMCWLDDVERFLSDHQAMGVYLYGELMISENARMQALARKVFHSLRPCMAENQRLAVEEMLFPK